MLIQFDLQDCCNSLWHRFNKVMETFLRDFAQYWNVCFTTFYWTEMCWDHLSPANSLPCSGNQLQLAVALRHRGLSCCKEPLEDGPLWLFTQVGSIGTKDAEVCQDNILKAILPAAGTADMRLDGSLFWCCLHSILSQPSSCWSRYPDPLELDISVSRCQILVKNPKDIIKHVETGAIATLFPLWTHSKKCHDCCSRSLNVPQ